MQHKFCVQDLLPAARRMPHRPHAASRCPSLPLVARCWPRTQSHTAVLFNGTTVCVLVCVCKEGGVCLFNFKANEWPFEQDNNNNNNENCKKTKKKSTKKQGKPAPKPLKKCPGRRPKHLGCSLCGGEEGLGIVVVGFYSFLICHFW